MMVARCYAAAYLEYALGRLFQFNARQANFYTNM